MSARFYLALAAQRIVDLCFMLLPRRRPSKQALTECRIVSHRGEHDNRRVRENTLAAFRAVAAAGIWGVEFDVRWTRDLHPVVIHDPETGRVFGIDLAIAEVSLAELRRQIPDIPTLEEVVEEFGNRMHLMIELKHDRLNQGKIKAARLAEVFATFRPAKDFHFLALQADLFELTGFAGHKACLLVAELEVSDFSQQVIEHDYGGLCGHYLLLSSRLLGLHHARGQKLGTGFPGSRQCFVRELNRNVDWIFTNRALKLKRIREQLLHEQ